MDEPHSLIPVPVPPTRSADVRQRFLGAIQARSVPLQLGVVGLSILLVVLWYAWPALHAGALIGAPATDVIRAAWGLDHTWQALPSSPIWTDRIGFPAGVKILLLPEISLLLGSPLVGLFGPVVGYDVWIVCVWASAGLGSAFLAWRITRSPAAALLAGTGMLVQPMLFLAITDGTAEFVAWWPVPVALAALYSARWTPTGARLARLGWGLLAGVLFGVVAIDSPYQAIFCAPFVPLVFDWRRWRGQWPVVVTILLSGVVLITLYAGLPLAVPNENVETNSVSLQVWQGWEARRVNGWDYTLGTGFIPWHVLAGAIALAVLRPRRTLPWLLIGLLALVWAMNAHPGNAQVMYRWLGTSGSRLAEGVVWFNTHFTPPVVRFPRRWLMPVAQAAAIAAAIGLTRLRPEWLRWLIAVPICVATVRHTELLTQFRAHLPHFTPPTPAFATFIAESPQRGAVLFLPRRRGAKHWTDRSDLPVFADLSRDLASADELWLQVLCRRPSAYWPVGLRTVAPVIADDTTAETLLNELDDLSDPQTTGRSLSSDVFEDSGRRVRVVGDLVDRGLSFVAVDEKTYQGESLALVRWLFNERIRVDRHFDDGTGVTVLVVGTQ